MTAATTLDEYVRQMVREEVEAAVRDSATVRDAVDAYDFRGAVDEVLADTDVVGDAVDRALEDHDFTDDVQAAIDDYDFTAAVESAVEDAVSESVETAIGDYDFTDAISEALRYGDVVSDTVADAIRESDLVERGDLGTAASEAVEEALYGRDFAEYVDERVAEAVRTALAEREAATPRARGEAVVGEWVAALRHFVRSVEHRLVAR